MQLIFNRQAAEQLQERYTVLELETFTVNDQLLEVFCVVPSDSIPADEMLELEHYKKLHNEFVIELKKENYTFCKELAQHLMGKFGGELDSFYSEILKRIESSTT